MDALWRSAYIGIGSNLDHPRERVVEAFAHLGAISKTRLVARSRHYRTRPMGPQDQPDFINAAAGMLTQLGARELLTALKDIERAMHRAEVARWGPRVIDLDLLWMFDTAIDEPGFSLPHPGVPTRNFVLYPLADIAPTLMIPGLGAVSNLLRRAGDDGISVLEEPTN